MGILTDTMRMQYLNCVKMDLEYKVQLVTQARMDLTAMNQDLLQVGNDYDPDSPIVKTLQQRQAKLKAMEQKLEQQMNSYQLRLKMVETELESCRARLDKNIQKAFSY